MGIFSKDDGSAHKGDCLKLRDDIVDLIQSGSYSMMDIIMVLESVKTCYVIELTKKDIDREEEKRKEEDIAQKKDPIAIFLVDREGAVQV